MQSQEQPRRWTPEEHERAKRLRGLGLKDTEIAVELDRSLKSVRSHLARSDDPLGFIDREWREDEISALTFGVRRGFSARDLAIDLGRPRRVVMAKAHALGLAFADSSLSAVSNSTAVRAINRARAGAASFATLRESARRLPAPAAGEARAYDATRTAKSVAFADLKPGCCRFAVTAHDVPASEHRFCAAPVVDRLAGESNPHANYCAHHAARVRSRD